jgi:hypothetical protein
VPVPVDGRLRSVTAVRPDDVWMSGADRAGEEFVLHWDGQHWTRRSDLGIAGVARPRGVFTAGGGAWLYGREHEGKPFLLQLGATVGRVDLPAGAGDDLTAAVDDGHGGLWLAGYVGGIDFPKAVYSHRTSSGSWTVTRAPEDPRGRRDRSYGGGRINDMALIPGTDTIWAVGAKGSNEQEYSYYRLVQTLR